MFLNVLLNGFVQLRNISLSYTCYSKTWLFVQNVGGGSRPESNSMSPLQIFEQVLNKTSVLDSKQKRYW